MNKMPLVIKKIQEMINFASSLSGGLSIGFVPTMGYLHEGHLSLVKKSVNENSKTIISIFVNPSQFGQNEDFNKYPRDLDRDLNLLYDLNVDVVFIPDYEEIYPKNFKTWVEVDELSSLYCGKSRPGHFKGVATIVNKLVNIVKPHKMYMGEKDFQQVFILEKMLLDLNIMTKIVRCPIIRESDGLAMSSRNIYLSYSERENALALYRSLLLAKELYYKGIDEIETVKTKMINLIKENHGIVDYIAFVNNNSFLEEKKITDETRILLAVRIGNTRLIDNMKL